MKVVHLPTNIASQMGVTVAALRRAGVDAEGYSGASAVQNGSGLFPLPPQSGSPWQRTRAALARHALLMEAVSRADVVHWHYGPGLFKGADVRLAALLGKRCFVEFWGSDIRVPEIESADNPFYQAARLEPGFECASESRESSRRTQHLFAAHGARALISSPGLVPSVDRTAFPGFLMTAPRVRPADYPPAFPSGAGTRPLVVHAPTAPVTKGSRFVLAAVEELRSRFDFDFKLITGMPHHEARQWIARSDLFIDQLVIGDFGLASVEAMALGKPVICYVKPSLQSRYPRELPLVNASPVTLPEVLAGLLGDGPRRHRLGRESREWVETHHDADRFIQQLTGYYTAA